MPTAAMLEHWPFHYNDKDCSLKVHHYFLFQHNTQGTHYYWVEKMYKKTFHIAKFQLNTDLFPQDDW